MVHCQHRSFSRLRESARLHHFSTLHRCRLLLLPERFDHKSPVACHPTSQPKKQTNQLSQPDQKPVMETNELKHSNQSTISRQKFTSCKILNLKNLILSIKYSQKEQHKPTNRLTKQQNITKPTSQYQPKQTNKKKHHEDLQSEAARSGRSKMHVPGRGQTSPPAPSGSTGLWGL